MHSNRRRIVVKTGFIIVFMIIFWVLGYVSSQENRPENTERNKDDKIFFNQEPPGPIPKIFAPGVLSTLKSECLAVIFPDGNEIWYIIQHKHNQTSTYSIRKKGNNWSQPEIVDFASKYSVGQLSLCMDGKRIYFSSKGKDIDPNNVKLDWDIWYTDKTESGWSEPIKIGYPINTEANERQPFLSASGQLYFTSDKEGTIGGLDIFISKRQNGHFSEPINLGDRINSEKWEWDVYVSPGDDYLVFSSNKESRNPNRFDLFISFRGSEGVWLEPQNMGSIINTDESEMDFLLSPDGKYIFFTSSRIHPAADKVGYGNGRADIYWVNAKIIGRFRPENLKN